MKIVCLFSQLDDFCDSLLAFLYNKSFWKYVLFLKERIYSSGEILSFLAMTPINKGGKNIFASLASAFISLKTQVIDTHFCGIIEAIHTSTHMFIQKKKQMSLNYPRCSTTQSRVCIYVTSYIPEMLKMSLPISIHSILQQIVLGSLIFINSCFSSVNFSVFNA